MQVGDAVVATSEMKFDENLTIPAGAKGFIASIDTRPERVEEKNWFGWNVCFPDYMQTCQTYPCLKTEIELTGE